MKAAFFVSILLVAAVAALLTSTPCPAAAPAPATRPAPPATRPAAECDAALNLFAARNKDLKSFKADFVQDINNVLFNVQSQRTGTILMLKPHFLRIVWKTPPPGEEAVYDGKNFWEIKHGTKQVIKHALGNQGAGQPQLNAGPFKFLAGVTAEQVRKDYGVALLDAPADAANYRFLLIPLNPNEKVDYVKLEVWIDRTTLLPVRFTMVKPNKEVETWTFKAAAANAGVAEKDFEVVVPRGYQLIVNPLGGGPGGPNAP